MNRQLTRQECRNIQLQILNEIKSVCDQNNFHYYLAYGTLLGAVRHQGYIPWDDDIDICMPREEYESLIRLLKHKSQKRCQWLDIIDGDQPGYYYTFAKAVHNQTVAKMEDNLTEHGIWVDIFPLDGLPEGVWKRTVLLKYCYFLRSLVLSMTTDFTGGAKGGKRALKRLLNLGANIVGRDKIYRHYQRICRKYDYEKSKYIGMLFSAYGARDYFCKDRIEESKEYVFENFKYTGYADSDYYLSKLYGDYMKLPPEKEQKNHKIIAYWQKEIDDHE